MYSLIQFALLTSALSTLTLTFDVQPILDNMAKKNWTTTNVRVIFKNDNHKNILADLKNRRSSLNLVPRSQEGKMNEFYKSLKDHSDEIQKKTKDNLQELINSRAASNSKDSIIPSFTQMWIRNQLYVWNADEHVINQLAGMEDVSDMKVDDYDALFPIEPTIPRTSNEEEKEYVNIANKLWGSKAIGVTEGWDKGRTGQGVVIGIIDSGVNYNHETLRGNWRDQYGWFDMLRHTEYPEDDHGHGTRVAGIAVGSKGVGVAHGAQWIACTGIHKYFSTQEQDPSPNPVKGRFIHRAGTMATETCWQWMNCPTNHEGKNEDCSKRPHIVNNSYGMSAMDEVAAEIDSWIENGIIPIFAAGNFGPNCSSVGWPGALASVITVGMTGHTGEIVPASSSGPALVKGKNNVDVYNVKPDVVAPGADIYSASNNSNTKYNSDTGTSFAAPYVAGFAALYYKDAPFFEKNVDLFRTVLIKGVRKMAKTSGQNCGNISEQEYPNNRVGYGLIDVTEFEKSIHKHIINQNDQKNGILNLYQPNVLPIFTMLIIRICY